jgi:hypothetical protein
MEEKLVSDESKRRGREQLNHNVIRYPSIWLQGEKKTTENSLRIVDI